MINAYLIDKTVKFNFLKNDKKFYSILRSPFVYKISQEQFFFDNFSGIIVLKMNNTNNFFMKYLDFFFKNFLKN
jgi:ribosomal protein S10